MKRFVGLIGIACLALLAACGSQGETPKSKETVSPEKVKREVKEGAEATKQYMLQQKDK